MVSESSRVAVEFGPVFFRSIHRVGKQCSRLNPNVCTVSPSTEALQELDWWFSLDTNFQCTHVWKDFHPYLEIRTDASLSGYGIFTSDGRCIQGNWESIEHTNILEMKAVIHSLDIICQNTSIAFFVDNTTAFILFQGNGRNEEQINVNFSSNVLEEKHRNELQGEILLDRDNRQCGSRFPFMPGSGNLELTLLPQIFQEITRFWCKSKYNSFASVKGMPPNREICFLASGRHSNCSRCICDKLGERGLLLFRQFHLFTKY
ncbi:unnamed protein product [Lepeophtheirus salmonis]|uniref:(salmon louse) hypothetical protein n=1 Tax=Lepeophtheirus salmonis TaxID=72036 RepID=A0A7R8CC18_LEPSM|nr:unnamed protein product [Lepeophtheirus salmonis]CAF2763939.1 unnamed protein product [Lepeophtheirus salmonis]